MSSFSRNCIFFTCFSIFTSLFGKFLLHLDINKRTYNHVPGECGVIPNLPGMLALTTTTGGRLYLTVSPKDTLDHVTHLFTFYSDNRTAREITIWHSRNSLKLRPGPISATTDAINPKVFVKNERTGNVEVFETNDQTDTWKHSKSLKNSDFKGISHISASGPNSFYYIKRHNVFDSFERLLPFSFGEISFSKGSEIQHVMYVTSPTGIVYDNYKKTLLVASYYGNSIIAVKITNGYQILSRKEHDIGCSPTSLWRDFDGSFVVTCQPIRFRYFLKLFDLVKTAPSMVLRVVIPSDESKEIAINQLYSNDGATISEANLAVRSGRSLLISEGEKILNCHL